MQDRRELLQISSKVCISLRTQSTLTKMLFADVNVVLKMLKGPSSVNSRARKASLLVFFSSYGELIVRRNWIKRKSNVITRRNET